MDRLQNLGEEVAKLNAAADADREFVASLLDILQAKIGVQGQSVGGAEVAAADSYPPAAAPQAPMPVSMMGETGLSRGPAPGMDQAGMVAELERALSGTGG